MSSKSRHQARAVVKRKRASSETSHQARAVIKRKQAPSENMHPRSGPSAPPAEPDFAVTWLASPRVRLTIPTSDRCFCAHSKTRQIPRRPAHPVNLTKITPRPPHKNGQRPTNSLFRNNSIRVLPRQSNHRSTEKSSIRLSSQNPKIKFILFVFPSLRRRRTRGTM